MPVYLKAVSAAPVLELLSHRVVWALVVVLLLLWRRGEAHALRAALGQRRTLAVLGASTVFIALNWSIYIYAVVTSRMLEGSLGYYINPLVNVLLGVAVLGERLAPLQRVAVGLAGAGVLWMALGVGHFPWISLALAVSFGLYGLARKMAPVGSLVGLGVETLLLLPFAFGYLVYQLASGRAVFLSGRPALDALLVLAGPATAIPLLFFAGAARRLDLSTLGFLQYLSPTCQLLLAVFVYGEPFDRRRLLAFALIWAGLALSAIHGLRRRAPDVVVPE